MARVTVEDCLEKVENRFALVHLASSRARDLRLGRADALIEGKNNKECVTALREVAAGGIYFDEEVKAQKMQEDQKRLDRFQKR